MVVLEGAATVLYKLVGTGGKGGTNNRARSAVDNEEAGNLGKKVKLLERVDG